MMGQREIPRQMMVNNEYKMRNQMNDPDFNPGIPQGRNNSEGMVRRQTSGIMSYATEPRQSNQPVNNYSTQVKRERRSKKTYDYPQYNRPMQDFDEFNNPLNSELMERRSTSNNRFGLGEDRGTEKSNKDSFPFPMEDQDNDFSNKDSPQDNDLMNFPRNDQDNEPSLGEDMNRLNSREIMRQDSNRFTMNYDGNNPNESFGGTNFNFRDNAMMDFNENKFGGAQFQPQANNFSYNNSEFRNFPMNQVNSSNRMHQNSFNNPFDSFGRGQGFGQDYSSNVMNPNNSQYNDQMRTPYYMNNDMGVRRNNSFGGKR